MPEAALALPIILVAAWLPGWLVLGHFDRGDLRPAERHFAALNLGLAFVGWLAFLLAELGAFSLGLLALLWLPAVAVLPLSESVLPRRYKKVESPESAGQSKGETEKATEKSQPAPRSLRLSNPNRLEIAMLILWLPAALWLFLRPHEAILGGADAGVYVATAAQIAREGSIVVREPALAAMDASLQAAVLRPIPDGGSIAAYLFPAFNVADADSGTIIPDFFHLHPSWQAVAFTLGAPWGDAAAVHAALLLPGMWALLGALAVYFTLRQALEQVPVTASGAAFATLFAGLGLAALSLNAIQVWFARYPVTEMLTQYLLWTGLWALGAWLAARRPLPIWGLLAGLSLGLVLLTRIDMLFILAIPVMTAAWQIAQRGSRHELRRAHVWFYLPLALLALHMALHSAFISRPYFQRITGYGQLLLDRLGFLLPILVAAALLAFWFVWRHGMTLWRPRLHRPLLALVALAVLGLAAYGWFLRPVYGALPSYSEWYDGQTIVVTDRENLVRLAWYLAPLGVWLGIAGALLMIWRGNRRSVAIVGVGLFFSLVYLWRIQANPHQIYVMRRYVPVVMPFFVVASAFLLHALSRTDLTDPSALRARHAAWRLRGKSFRGMDPVLAGSRLLALLLAFTWLASMLWSARGFVTQVDYRGLTAQLAQLAQELPDGSVLLFDDQSPISVGDALGTPLHYVFGHDVFTLRAPDALDDGVLASSIESWQNNGRSVYWVGGPDWLQEHGFDFQSGEVRITGQALEGSYDHKPYRIIPLSWTLNLNLVEPR